MVMSTLRYLSALSAPFKFTHGLKALPIVMGVCATSMPGGALKAADNWYTGQPLGPFIADPEVLKILDCPDSDCEGPLSFVHLMQSNLYKKIRGITLPGNNPFVVREKETAEIVSTVKTDLDNIRVANGSPPFQLDPNFLQHPSSRVQLVGIINRMDRQLHQSQRESKCGEVSLIYRFAYPLSRLPVTMNIVFPAAAGSLNCKTAAKRWLKALEAQGSESPEDFAKRLMSKRIGPIPHLVGRNISRLELNMQTYRKPASADPKDFGSEANYLIRVYRWNEKLQRFQPSELPNEIDRNGLVCLPQEPAEICAMKRARRSALVKYLQRPKVVAKIDNGTLDIPKGLGVLSRRALSVSPGGQHRSVNQPYWDASVASNRDSANVRREQVITDSEIKRAIEAAKRAGVVLKNTGNVADFRQRLNDSTCSGCHQTRAIAGFHFPGLDPFGTPPSNAVYLAGSPHFYGDQPRRMDVVKAIAKSASGWVPDKILMTSYSARPMKKYEKALGKTALIGGWGGACLLESAFLKSPSKRNWPCKAGLVCRQLFESPNTNGVGTCVPDGRFEIGDYLQSGAVQTTGWGHDGYARRTPIFDDTIEDTEDNRIARIYGIDEYIERRTTIASKFLPAQAPAGNSYYGSHQEFYIGHRGDLLKQIEAQCASGAKPMTDCYAIRRDALSGGFPSGMLRLSECVGLPSEATCALVASSGFNKCISKLGKPGFEDFKIETCFAYFTSYAGMRACDVGNPCRDDYICVAPVDPNPKANFRKLYDDRLSRLEDASANSPWLRIIGKPYDKNQFGQQLADDEWIARNDTRGICIPPYFVFQFRSDNHPPFPENYLQEGGEPRAYEEEGQF